MLQADTIACVCGAQVYSGAATAAVWRCTAWCTTPNAMYDLMYDCDFSIDVHKASPRLTKSTSRAACLA